jgi:teichuronic acid biosynthesis glycosyltransferase TuaG
MLTSCNEPLVSVVTPIFNGSKFIRQTYNSLLNQSHVNWEWLVVDDASTDNTKSILQELSYKDKRIRYFHFARNVGPAVARNTGIKNAFGKYIAFLDSDDLWYSIKLEKQLDFMTTTGCSFSFTAYTIISQDANETGKIVDSSLTGKVGYNDMLKKKATLGCSTVMLERTAFDDLQFPLIRTGQDYALWLKLLKTGTEAYIFPETLTKYRIVKGSISRNKFNKARRQWEIYRSIEGLSFVYASFCFCFYAFRAVFRR